MAHHHLCVSCKAAKVACGGTWERNYDGFPESICTSYHLPNGEVNQKCLCEPCRQKQASDAD